MSEQMRTEFEAWARENCVQSLERYGDTYNNTHIRARWEGWQAALASAEQWIDVAKSLPEKDVWVLVYEDDNDNAQDRFIAQMLNTFRQRVTPAKLLNIDNEGYADWYLCIIGGGPVSITRNVTHWMPLPSGPAAPKEPK